MPEKTREERRRVQVSRADSACGYVGYMTVGELKKVTIGDNFVVGAGAFQDNQSPALPGNDSGRDRTNSLISSRTRR
jgi:hypothetical protein